MVQGRTGGMGDPPVTRKRDTPGLEPHWCSGNTVPEFTLGWIREMAASSLRKLGGPQNPAYGFHRNEGRVAKRPSGLRLFRSVGLLIRCFDSLSDISKLAINLVDFLKLLQRFHFFTHLFKNHTQGVDGIFLHHIHGHDFRGG